MTPCYLAFDNWPIATVESMGLPTLPTAFFSLLLCFGVLLLATIQEILRYAFAWLC